MKKVLVFGVFDGVHDGHRALFRQAKEHGDHLIVAVAQDAVVEQLKGRKPKKNLEERIKELLREVPFLINEVIPGDEILGTYEVIKLHKPHIIALGYDQQILGEDIRRAFSASLEVRFMESYDPGRYHSSLLNDSTTSS